MNWRSTMRVVDWAVPLGFGMVLCLVAPLRTALEFGGDEGVELMKAFLVSLGHPLYREVWNDQPPLHTQLLALLFQVFGPSAYVGRLLSVAFAMVLVGSLYKVVSDQSGRLAGLIAVGLVVSSSFFLQLSVSAMIELPAMALAMAAVWAWSKYFAGKGRGWLVISGALFGCALQVKLTAAIFVPALALDYLVKRLGRKRRMCSLEGQVLWGQFREPMVWSGAVLAAFGLIAAAFYSVDTVSMFWSSHFSEATRRAVASEGYGFRPESLLSEVALVPASVGVLLICFKRRWDLVFPLVLLVTAFVIHFWHRPYWYYYGLHFAMPMAWLGAIGIVEWFRALWKQDLRASMAAKLRFGIGWLGWSTVLSVVLTLAPEKGWSELMRLSAGYPALQDGRVVDLRKDAAQTHWVFTDRVIYAFWAGLPVPPELAVIPQKRIWSGQLSETEVLKCLERYRPEQVFLLSGWRDRPALSDYIRAHYKSDPASVAGELYLRKE